ncbi:MAG: DUF505 domain-containing protein [Candidatus Diapherotrites archaeon]|nr:DUF505 domain-containing protein [Candidatus Diapherotrites archaeon]
MFIRRDDLRVLNEIASGVSERDAGRSFRSQAMILYLNGLVAFKDEGVELTDAGKILLDAVRNADINSLPDVVADSAAVEALRLWKETGFAPAEWIKFLENRGLAEEGRINELGEAVLKAYESASPVFVLTNDVISFLSSVPQVGTYDDLVEFADLGGYGKNVLAALQAMRLLRVSPPTAGRASYVITPAAKKILEAIGHAPKVVISIVFGPEEAEAVDANRILESLVQSGIQSSSGVTEFGSLLRDAYALVTERKKVLPPAFLTQEEHDVLKAIKEIQRIHRQTPAIIADYNTIRERLEKDGSRAAEDLGEHLNMLLARGFIVRGEADGKFIYLLTDLGRTALAHGPVSVEAVKAITYALAGELPLAEWVDIARRDGVLAGGITSKGEFYLDVSRGRADVVYITGYDAAVVSKVPRKKYIRLDDLIREVAEYFADEGEEKIRKAIAVAESKNLIDILPNGAVRLSERGANVKGIVDGAKARDFIHTRFAVTPLAYSIVREIYENSDEVNRIWKKSQENRKDFYGELAKWLTNRVRASVEDVVKTLEILHKIGILGEKSLTEAGKELAVLLD